MVLDPAKVNLAMAQGLSAVCATCQKYWEARERGIPGDGCTSKMRCGSPISGDAFSDYDGPLKGSLHQWCFVCAKQSDFGIRVTGRLTTIGVCREHVRYVENLRAVGKPEIRVEVQDARGAAPGVIPTKRSLADAINEVESYYAKKEGRDPNG